MNLSDTIVAISTPPGRGAIGIVRISGERAVEVAASILKLPHPIASWRPALTSLMDGEGELVDQVIVTLFGRGESYTGEDVIEISCHGSPVVMRQALEGLLRAGARLAEPGEFTLRAFARGRIDLPQAEAVRDLIDATTLYQARLAARQATGSLARVVAPLKAQLVELISLLEAGIDFAEDDVSVASSAELLRRLDLFAPEIDRIVRSWSWGHLVREGFTLAIVGRPNVGKSSLFNRLLEQDRAIVTEIPGTTRDLVSEVVAIGGIPVRLVDTAGIREGQDVVETLGIERSYRAMADADLTLVVIDAPAGMVEGDAELVGRARGQGRYLLVANKADLGRVLVDGATYVSALRGEGVEELRRAIVAAVSPGEDFGSAGAIVTNARQQQALGECAGSLGAARAAIEAELPHEMVLVDLYAALSGLDALTGRTTADDILNRIFATFCIGK